MEDVTLTVQRAREAIKSGDYDSAESAYADAFLAHPDRADLAFNLGVVRFRKGDFSEAIQAFDTAASLSQGPLRNQSIYNSGTSAYAQAMQLLSRQGDRDRDDHGQAIQDAVESLRQSLSHLIRAAADAPESDDARINGELAQRLLRMLEVMQQQQQQQRPSSEQATDSPEGKTGQNDKSNTDQAAETDAESPATDTGTTDKQGNPGTETGSQDQGTASSQSEPDPTLGSEPTTSSQDAPGQTNHEPSKMTSNARDQDPQPSPKPRESTQDSRVPKPPQSPMSQEEIDRLLQAVRDKDRQRRELIHARSDAKNPQPTRAPLKDW